VKRFLEPGLKEAGIAVTVNEGVSADITDMTALLAKVSRPTPDAVFLAVLSERLAASM